MLCKIVQSLIECPVAILWLLNQTLANETIPNRSNKMTPALIFISLIVVTFLLGKVSGERLLQVYRAPSPALQIAFSAGRSLLVFVVMLAILFALKQEFDSPRFLNPEYWSYPN